ncbi:lysoplasmalogenase [Stigmatella hybrida]|uniref:lysoplasmalogenase n=1 Tax=Stigmatella hybrida TaxID=394097 RepID=UPI001CDB2D32|nr:lysoplasmalogenase [Stigmatella hybrida]
MLPSTAHPRRTSLPRIFLGAFVTAALVNCAANLSGFGGPWLAFCSKGVLMPLLAAFLYASTRGRSTSLPLRFLFLALGLCWAGDISLGLPGHDLFLVGMAAFGLAHLCYIRTFLDGVQLKRLNRRDAVTYGLPFAVYGYTLYPVIAAHMTGGNMRYRLPVLIYMALVLTSAISGLLRTFQFNSSSSTSVLAGAVLFVLSDSIVALSRFVVPLPAMNFAIMGTYLFAQYLIVKGCVPAAA